MAGKTVAKAAVKKTDGKKADGVKKAAKSVAVVKKADGVKKPVAKKPNVGTKFNLHKLIMLIIRDAPKDKKGNKMTGGYDAASIQPIKDIIINFINDKSKKIRDRITDSYSLESNQTHISYADTTANYITLPINGKNIVAYFHTFVGNILDPNFNKVILDINKPTPFNNLSDNMRDIRTYNVNFMKILIALCDVYMRYHNNVKGLTEANKINITDMPP
jgi:hypothetical protein